MKPFAFQHFCCSNCFPIESTSRQYNCDYLISDKSWMHTPEALAKHYIGYNAKVRVSPASPSAFNLNFISLSDQRCTQEDPALSFCSSGASPQSEEHEHFFVCIWTSTYCCCTLSWKRFITRDVLQKGIYLAPQSRKITKHSLSKSGCLTAQ